MNLLYESQANLGFYVLFATASTLLAFSPKFKIVSIIPGIEAAAPERIESKRGSLSSPNLLFIKASSFFMFMSI